VNGSNWIKKVKGSRLKKWTWTFPWLCKLVYEVGKKKLNISLSFKFGLCNSNYFKSMKLNFVLLNQELTKRQNIFLTP